jgi:hypothetical protein
MSKRRRKTPKKPSGTSGLVAFGDAFPPRYVPVTFPTEKLEIERQVLESALLASKHGGLDLYSFYRLAGKPVQYEAENNFDYMLPTATGQEQLDLEEVAPLERLGRSYDAVELAYLHGERADAIYSLIRKKVQGYGPNPSSVIHLMLYATDWRLHICTGVLDLLSYWLLRDEHWFKSVVYFAPEAEGSGELEVIFPRKREDFVGFDESYRRGWQTGIADLGNLREVPGGVALKPRAIKEPGPGEVKIEIRSARAPGGGFTTTYSRIIAPPPLEAE